MNPPSAWLFGEIALLLWLVTLALWYWDHYRLLRRQRQVAAAASIVAEPVPVTAAEPPAGPARALLAEFLPVTAAVTEAERLASWHAHLDSWGCSLYLVDQQTAIFELWDLHLEMQTKRTQLSILPGGQLDLPAVRLGVPELAAVVHRTFVQRQYPGVLVPHILPVCLTMARYYVARHVAPLYRPYFDLSPPAYPVPEVK